MSCACHSDDDEVAEKWFVWDATRGTYPVESFNFKKDAEEYVAKKLIGGASKLSFAIYHGTQVEFEVKLEAKVRVK